MNVYGGHSKPSANILAKILGLVLCSVVLSACGKNSDPHQTPSSKQEIETPNAIGGDESTQQDEPSEELSRDIGVLSKEVKDIIPNVNAQIKEAVSEINTTLKVEVGHVYNFLVVVAILGVFLLVIFCLLLQAIKNLQKNIKKLVGGVDRLEMKIDAVGNRNKTISEYISKLSSPRSLVPPVPRPTEPLAPAGRPTEPLAPVGRPTIRQVTDVYNDSAKDEDFQSRFAPIVLKIENLDARRANSQIKPVFVEDQSGRYFVIHCIDGSVVFPKKEPVIMDANRRSGALDEIYECQESKPSSRGDYKIRSVTSPAEIKEGFNGWRITGRGKLNLYPYE